jgi:hypothetical protein
VLDRRRLAEQLACRGRPARRLVRHLERLLDQRAQLLERDRLREVVERPGLERGDRVLRAAERRDHGDGHVEALLVDVLDDAQALAVGQPHVGEARSSSRVEPVASPRFRARGVEAHPRERELEQLEQVGLVVDQENFGLATGFSGHELPLILLRD